MLRTIIAAAALFAAPAFAETITIETYSGTADVEKNPAIVAVYDAAALDSLSALGVQVQGVMAPHYLSYLDEAANAATPVGSFFEPDFEALAALAPNLIIGGGRATAHAEAFAKIAPTIDMTIWEDTVGQGLDRLSAYGALFGKKAEADALAAEFDAKLNRVREALAGKGKALIIMTNGPKISAYGADGRFGWLHKNLGLEEAATGVESSSHGEATSFEFIKDTNPDILIVMDRLAAIGQDGDRAQATLDNALVHDTNAWKNGQVIFLTSAPLYIAGGGIQSMNITLDEFLSVFEGK